MERNRSCPAVSLMNAKLCDCVDATIEIIYQRNLIVFIWLLPYLKLQKSTKKVYGK